MVHLGFISLISACGNRQVNASSGPAAVASLEPMQTPVKACLFGLGNDSAGAGALDFVLLYPCSRCAISACDMDHLAAFCDDGRYFTIRQLGSLVSRSVGYDAGRDEVNHSKGDGSEGVVGIQRSERGACRICTSPPVDSSEGTVSAYLFWGPNGAFVV